MLLVAGGPSQAMGVKFDEIAAADFGFGTLDRKYTIVVWLVDERGRPLRGGRHIRMSLRSKKSGFPSNSVEFDENDLIQMGVSPRRVEKGGLEKTEWPEKVNVLAHEVSQWSPVTLWSHPEPGLRWSFRLAVIFAALAFTLERAWEVVRSIISAQ